MKDLFSRLYCTGYEADFFDLLRSEFNYHPTVEWVDAVLEALDRLNPEFKPGYRARMVRELGSWRDRITEPESYPERDVMDFESDMGSDRLNLREIVLIYVYDREPVTKTEGVADYRAAGYSPEHQYIEYLHWASRANRICDEGRVKNRNKAGAIEKIIPFLTTEDGKRRAKLELGIIKAKF